MQRNPTQLSLKDCYDILNLAKDASLEDVKHAYRVRAFELHPDLNPDDPLAAKNFQLLNEAYVALSAVLRAKEESGAQEKKSGSAGQKQQTTDEKRREKAYAEQDVLRDLLNDPFARRVFEDIYSELAKKQTKKAEAPKKEKLKPESAPKKEKIRPSVKAQASEHKERRPITMSKEADLPAKQEKGVGNLVKGWLKRQIDDELTLSLPPNSLQPGKRLRLQIRHGISNDIQTIDVTIPQDFVLGKPIRLKGLGKHIGPWQGDLYLILQTV